MPRRNDIAKILIIGSTTILIALLLLRPAAAHGCSVFAKTVNAAPNFNVIVQDHGRPVAGIAITVTRIADESHTPLFTLKSDQDGEVVIRGLQPGMYAISNVGPIQTAGLLATIKSNGPVALPKPIAFDWPWYGIAKTHRLRGRLRAADPRAPIEEIDLNLTTVNSGSLIKAVHSGPDGQFDFGDVKPGLYVVQVRTKQPAAGSGWEINGPIAVQVAPDSATAGDHLDLPLGETSCGIWYAQCSQTAPISLSSRRIRLTDPNGAVVASAQYSMEDRSGNRVATGQSDRQGVVQLPRELKGTYKLSIYSAGFTPLEQPLQLVPFKPGAEDLDVVLKIGGTCSEAKLEKHATP